MHAISEKSGVQWQRQAGARDLEVGKWRLLLGADDVPTGCVYFRLRSLLDVERLHQQVHGGVIQVNGVFCPLEIFSKAMVSGTFRGQNP